MRCTARKRPARARSSPPASPNRSRRRTCRRASPRCRRPKSPRALRPANPQKKKAAVWPPSVISIAGRLFAVERRIDLGHFLGLARLVRRDAVAAVRLRLAAEVDAQLLQRQALAVAGADLLERAQQSRPLVGLLRHLLGRAYLDVPVLLETGRRR